MKQFYLGTHMPNWLGVLEVPTFQSRIRLARYAGSYFPTAKAPWMLDACGFSELSKYGSYSTTATVYSQEARNYFHRIGKLDYATIQDWPCEPDVRAITGKTVAQHQDFTVASYLQLSKMAPEIPWLPVLQGWDYHDYINCARMYKDVGVDVWTLPRVGVGSICRRQNTDEAVDLLEALSREGFKIHCFGLKATALQKIHPYIESADSMAWSYAGRMHPNTTHTHRARQCANCKEFALDWRTDLLNRLAPDPC